MGVLLALAPLVAVWPFADSYAQDWNTGYIRYVLLRASPARYLTAKALANALAGGLAISLSMVLGVALAHLIYPHNPPRAIYATYFGPHPREVFVEFHVARPVLYQLFLCAVGLPFGAAYATLGLALSTVARNRYVALAAPLLLYWIADFILAVLRLERWLLPVALQPTTMSGTTPANVFVPQSAVLVLSGLIVVVAAGRSREVLA